VALIEFTEKGLYCPPADLYIDPWRPVRRALITHAHADHSRWGMGVYAAHRHSIPVMRHRLGSIEAVGVDYGEKLRVNGVDVSFHPAGHIPGSAQIRLKFGKEIWVISGDYKLEDDGLAEPFAPVKCTHFVTESTFGLPIYRWQPQHEVMSDLNGWWAANRDYGLCSLVLTYALGKAQRILSSIDAGIGEVFVHGAVHQTNLALEHAGYSFPHARYLTSEIDKSRLRGALVLAPPSALGSPWVNRLKPYRTASASGWMALRGNRRRRNADRGFVLSDHADWESLNSAVEATGAEHIFVTHGYSDVFSDWLRAKGLRADTVKTAFEGESAEMKPARNGENDSE